MIMVQKWSFFKLFFLCFIGQENVFHDIPERKNAFLGYEKQELQKVENGHFSKGVNAWFVFKNGDFSNFVFR